MAAYSTSPRIRAVGPATPVHSPHHSVHSSSSSRLSVRNLTLHEYRKQQNSPASQATPPSKTLRRKAAVSGLKEIERVPSVSRTPLSTSRVPPRPLHISQSTQSLYTYQQLPPSPPHQQQDLSVDELFRSQSAEPRACYDPVNKVRKFKPIKRLPKPLSSTGHGPLPVAPAPLASVRSNQPRLSPLRTTSFPSFENSISNDSQTTPASFSLSKFPRPPNLADPSLSPLSDEDEPPRVNTASFASNAPATPPATPAVIHYRGASFDLVNPHSSLVLDNIVTPSRDLDSSDYLPLRSSEDPLAFSEMAPKRPLYGDLSSAYASIITRRGDDYPSPLNLNLPLPPTPVAQSPGSSAFDSPIQSPVTHATRSSFTDRKLTNESRFSLKQLTRSFTQRFSKTSEKAHEEELQEFSDSRVSLASVSFEGEFPRPLEQSYRAVTPRSSTFPEEPITPASPLDQAAHIMTQRSSPPSVEQPRYSTQRVFSAPLASIVPDDPSIEFGRAGDDRPYASESDFMTKPYYDELTSIYPSSSIYTNESRRHSKYAQSHSSNRKNNPYYERMSGGADALANEYKSDSIPQYPSSHRTSRRISKPLEQEIFHRSLQLEGEKMDTISKFIDQYRSTDGSNASQPFLSDTRVENAGPHDTSSDVPSYTAPAERPDVTRVTSGLSQFEFGFVQSEDNSKEETPLLPSGVGGADKSMLAPPPGLPPSMPAPLAPAFEYEESFDSPKRSEVSSKSPSYGDTRQLLQFSSQPVIEETTPTHPGLQQSSFYSQPSILSSLATPQKSLEQTEAIFTNAASERQTESIPAMWSKRISSHNLLRNKSNNNLDGQQEEQEKEKSSNLASYEDEVDLADWETVGNGSPHRGIRASVGESLADYSSSEGSHSSRDSMGFSGPFPVYEEPPLEPGTFKYRHPTPLHSHSNPFTSSPPSLSIGVSMLGTAVGSLETPLQSSPPASSTVPLSYSRSPDIHSSSTTSRQEYMPFTPWVTPYALSDKETQELLASGPNDEILYEDNEDNAGRNDSFESQNGSSPIQPMQIAIPTATTMDGSSDINSIPRENSFEKVTVIGSKGNLTGTPHGTGMHDTGSSVADNSSPGAIFDSSPLVSHTGEQTGYQMFKAAASRIHNMRTEAPDCFNQSKTFGVSHGSPGFYETPGRRGSINRIVPRIHTPPDLNERSPSEVTLYPQEPPFADPGPPAKRLSLRPPITPRDPRRRGSRAAVPGQTKLRQMVLAPSAQTLSSSDRSVNDSRLFGTNHSARPSTSNTNTPLRNPTGGPTVQTVLANEHSPHLLCPERAINPEEEEARRKLSWIIFAIFCILPPTLILYRWMGDHVIVNVTNGRFSHVAPKPKQVALGAGIAVNVSIIAAILLPILIAHAAGSL